MSNKESFRVQIGVINKQLGKKDGPSMAELTVRVFGSPSLKKKGVHVETGGELPETISPRECEVLITEFKLHIKHTASITIGE
jgi:hypothetical protein